MKNNIEEQYNRALEFLKEVDESKIAEGEKILSDILEEFPEFLPARIKYADLQLEAGFPFEAFELLQDGLKFSRDSFALRYLLGVARQKCWLLHSAEYQFKALLKEKPDDLELSRQLGWTKILKGEMAEGRELVRRSLSKELMNPYPYMDLGVSYVTSLEFDEGLKWLETAKNLKPNDPFILDKIEWAKEIRKHFEKFSDKDKKKMKQMREDPAELKLSAVQNMLLLAKDSHLSKSSYKEIQEEIKLSGFNPKMMEFDAPKTKDQKTAVEYIKYHQEVDDPERKISKQEFEKIKTKLLDKKTSSHEMKKCFIILAHQGTKEALNLLNEFLEEAPDNFEDWAKLALQECEMFSKAKPGQVIQILH